MTSPIDKLLEKSKQMREWQKGGSLISEAKDEIIRIAVEVIERNSHPHVEQFCKERCRDVLARIDSLAKEALEKAAQ